MAIPTLIALDALITSKSSRDIKKLAVPLAISIAVIGAALGARTFLSTSMSSHLDNLPDGRRQVKDLITRPYAALAVPVAPRRCGLGALRGRSGSAANPGSCRAFSTPPNKPDIGSPSCRCIALDKSDEPTVASSRYYIWLVQKLRRAPADDFAGQRRRPADGRCLRACGAPMEGQDTMSTCVVCTCLAPLLLAGSLSWAQPPAVPHHHEDNLEGGMPAASLVVIADGATNPNQISDQVARRHFLLSILLPGPSASPLEYQRHQLTLAALALDTKDLAALQASLLGKTEALLPLRNAIAQAGDPQQAQGRRAEYDAAVDAALERTMASLSESGRSKTDRYVSSEVKRRIRIYAQIPSTPKE